jgi:hypothetical protein
MTIFRVNGLRHRSLLQVLNQHNGIVTKSIVNWLTPLKNA